MSIEKKTFLTRDGCGGFPHFCSCVPIKIPVCLSWLSFELQIVIMLRQGIVHNIRRVNINFSQYRKMESFRIAVNLITWQFTHY